MFNTTFIAILILFIVPTVAGREILPANCHCRDWYGGCRQMGETWTDGDTWAYRCTATDGSDAEFLGCKVTVEPGQVQQISPGKNETMADRFWASCELNDIRQKLEIEPRCTIGGEHKHIGDQFRHGIFQWICMENGRWVIGCFFQNETADWNLLKLGEVAYVGLIRHTCDRYQEVPGVVQYHAEIRDDIPHQSPSNMGTNKLLPKLIDKRLRNTPTEWSHQNAELFIGEEGPRGNNVRVRYLPRSNAIQMPRMAFQNDTNRV